MEALMIALLQRVSSADVSVDGREIATIGPGLLVFACVERDDDLATVDRMARKIVAYRIFPDEGGRMNLSVLDCSGELLLVPQFTLAADTRKGLRPSFAAGPDPDRGLELFTEFANACEIAGIRPKLGVFGADMSVRLVNDGPATFWLRVTPPQMQPGSHFSVQ